MKILVIEDEKALADSICQYLAKESYLCEIGNNYENAMSRILSFDYDCILLDIMLPGGDGLKILNEIKSQKKEDGVIIISARGTVEDRIKGLQLGADDYLAKPFHLSELGARVYSLIRRKKFGSSNIVRTHELEIDILAHKVSVNDVPITLTRKEFDLFLFLVSNKNRIVSKSALAEHLSGEIADVLDNYDFIYAHLKNLKKKLSEGGLKDHIKTIYGVGYTWEDL